MKALESLIIGEKHASIEVSHNLIILSNPDIVKRQPYIHPVLGIDLFENSFWQFGYYFGLSRQCLIRRAMETLWGFIYEALPGYVIPKSSLPNRVFEKVYEA